VSFQDPAVDRVALMKFQRHVAVTLRGVDALRLMVRARVLVVG